MKYFDDINPVNNLSDYYAKSKASNNYKLLQVEKTSINELNTDITDLFNLLEINNAFGKTLDMYGEMVGQERGLATDSQYRFMIRSKVMQNLSNGDYGSVLKALYITFDCQPSDIIITEADEPCVVAVKKLPLAVISKAGLNIKQTTQLIKRLMPAGINIETFSFMGTFEFSENENDMRVDGLTKGFTDTEANMKETTSNGGYLGEIYDNDEEELPI